MVQALGLWYHPSPPLAGIAESYKDDDFRYKNELERFQISISLLQLFTDKHERKTGTSFVPVTFRTLISRTFI